MYKKPLLRDSNSPLRVVVYGRVSTEHEAQLSAFENQMDWYEQELSYHPNWVLIRTYADKGITGTSMLKRPQFIQMMRDATNDEFDLIITREVSRFARNTVDTLQQTRELSKLGVYVYFIMDNLWTDDPDGEYRLTQMAGQAQEESRKISERSKRGQEISRKKGVYYGSGNILGYDRHEEKVNGVKRVWFEINEEQARTVRAIFDMYLGGQGLTAIRFELERLGYKTAMGYTRWDDATISRILQRRFYLGEIEYGQSYVDSYLEQKRILNIGERPKEIVQGTHPPLVTQEEFDRVQARFDKHRRKETAVDEGEHKKRVYGKRGPIDVWTKLLECECGHKFNRKISHRDPYIQYDYKCYAQIRYGSLTTRQNHGLPTDGVCLSPIIQGWQLQMMAKHIFYKYFTDIELIVSATEDLLRESREIARSKLQQNEEAAEGLMREVQKLEKRLKGFQEMRADGEISKEEFKEHKSKIEDEIKALKVQIDTLLPDDEHDTEFDIASKLRIVRESLDGLKLPPTEQEDIPESVIDALVERIVVHQDHLDWFLRFAPTDPDGEKKPIDCCIKGDRKKGSLPPTFQDDTPGCYQEPPLRQHRERKPA